MKEKSRLTLLDMAKAFVYRVRRHGLVEGIRQVNADTQTYRETREALISFQQTAERYMAGEASDAEVLFLDAQDAFVQAKLRDLDKRLGE